MGGAEAPLRPVKSHGVAVGWWDGPYYVVPMVKRAVGVEIRCCGDGRKSTMIIAVFGWHQGMWGRDGWGRGTIQAGWGAWCGGGKLR